MDRQVINREAWMLVSGSAPRIVDRSQWDPGSTYQSANRVGSHASDAVLGARPDVSNADAAKGVALSALRNDRFGSMLETISNPQSSGAVAFMKQGSDGSDIGAALSGYAENF